MAAAGIVASSFGREIKLEGFQGRKTVNCGDYFVDWVNDGKPDDKNRYLEITLRNKVDWARIRDKFPFGFGNKGDTFEGTHDFSNGFTLRYGVDYDRGGYNVKSELFRRGESVSVSELMTGNPWIPFKGFFAKLIIGPTIQWSHEVYFDVVKSVAQGVKPENFPYDFIIEEFGKVKAELNNVRKKVENKGEKTIGDVLCERVGSCNEEAKKRLPELRRR